MQYIECQERINKEDLFIQGSFNIQKLTSKINYVKKLKEENYWIIPTGKEKGEKNPKFGI